MLSALSQCQSNSISTVVSSKFLNKNERKLKTMLSLSLFVYHRLGIGCKLHKIDCSENVYRPMFKSGTIALVKRDTWPHISMEVPIVLAVYLIPWIDHGIKISLYCLGIVWWMITDRDISINASIRYILEHIYLWEWAMRFGNKRCSACVMFCQIT